jgi:Glycosyl transferases group 1
MGILPWRLSALATEAVGSYRYFRNRCANILRSSDRDGRFKLLFYVPFYGYTGGSFAVISVANLLSDVCDVSIVTKTSNVMNKYVSNKVRMVSGSAEPYDFCIVESGVGDAEIARMKRGGAHVILTMHGAPPTTDGTKNHGYSDEQVTMAMAAADSVQYVSDVQLPFFDLAPTVHRRRISNYVPQTNRAGKSLVAGIVCDTTLAHKNADACVEAAERSAATRIEVWGKYRDRRSTERVRWNGFTSDKQRIYGSFDVLVHLSRLENQPLVILEALSAGIPCVLARLPAYASLEGLSGMFFVDADDPVAVSRAIDRALDCPDEVREGLIKFWDENYSPHAVRAQWMDYFEDVRTSKVSLKSGLGQPPSATG